MTRLTKILIVILVLLLLFFGVRWMLRPKVIIYSNDPADWVDQAEEGYGVDIEEATRGKGEFNFANQQLLIGIESHAFSYEGLYNGNFFSLTHIDARGKIAMAITPDMIPDDGILQGIMVERYFNKSIETHIFIDEDWRKALGDSINIVWGGDYSQSRPFVFNEVQKGIYHDFVQDDRGRLKDFGSTGGVQVGNMAPGGVDPAQAYNIIMMAIH